MTAPVRRLVAADGLPLVLRVAPHPTPRAAVLVVHGYSDHGGQYAHVLEQLQANGFTAAAGDLRGHGESGGRRGFVARFGDYLHDLDAMLAELRAQHPESGELPVFLLGHSLGGLVSAAYARSRPRVLTGLVLAAPFARLKYPVPAWKQRLAQVVSGALPGFGLPSGVPSELLSHDPSWVRRFETDPLAFARANARWFAETIAAQGAMAEARVAGAMPTLLLLAGDDRIVCNAAARTLHAALTSDPEAVREYPGLYHALFHELDHRLVVDDTVSWIDAVLGTSAVPPGSRS
ncbi:MAG: lysophospholipase [Ectothiorhodospiraceae bacterium]|nr:lysophospholipase [Chromatiales bacterium]MCP5154881.1 lysophospholipase [Ectothiorhodospiraceae bacterium]